MLANKEEGGQINFIHASHFLFLRYDYFFTKSLPHRAFDTKHTDKLFQIKMVYFRAIFQIPS